MKAARAAPTRSVVDSSDARRRDLAAIHMGAAALGWSNDEYRDILYTVTGQRSSGKLDFSGRKRFLEHLRQCGWAGQAKRADGAAKGPRRAELTPTQKLVWSLWQQLGDAGLVETRTMAALNAWIERQTQVRRLEWLNQSQMDLVLQSLRGWLARDRVDEGKP